MYVHRINLASCDLSNAEITAPEFTIMLYQALTTIVLKRNAITTALPPPALLADPTRSSSDLIYVLFENIDDNTQRQYVITIQEDSPSSWRMMVSATPTIAGSMLLSVGGVHNFMARFNATGEARFEGLPVDLILDADGPDFEFAVLPPNM